MFFVRSSFWTGKNESLAQDLAGSLIKTVFIAAIAFLVMEYAKHLVERHEKRRALVAFQNKIIQDSISGIQDGYQNTLPCTQEYFRFREVDCANNLKSFKSLLDRRSKVLSGILGIQENYYSDLQGAVESLIAAHTARADPTGVEELSEDVNESVRSAIHHLASEIR